MRLSDAQLLEYLNNLRKLPTPINSTDCQNINTASNTPQKSKDFNAIKNLTDIEIKRLGWTTEQGRNYLMKNHGVRSALQVRGAQSRLKLTDVQH